jgi:NADH-quinone oxidoreductase subunit C
MADPSSTPNATGPAAPDRKAPAPDRKASEPDRKDPAPKASPTPSAPGPAAKPPTGSAVGAKPVDAAPKPPAMPAPAAPKATEAPAGAAPPKAGTPAAPPPPAGEPKGDFAMLRDAHREGVLRYEELEDGQGVLVVTPEELFTVAGEVKALGYRILSLLSAYDRPDHFGVLYAFLKPASTPAEFAELRLRCFMPKQADGKPQEPACPSLVDLFPAAGWQEREMYDMYGIRFEGNPDLRRMFLPDGWTGHPMRKDYKEPEQFVALREGEDIVVRTNEEGSW